MPPEGDANDTPYLDVEELTHYTIEKLQREGIAVPRDTVRRIFAIESEFMFIKGLMDDYDTSP
jgi:hypothetical protein